MSVRLSGAALSIPGVAVALVLILAGCSAPSAGTSSTPPVGPSREESTPSMSPGSEPTMTPQWCEGAEFPRASLDEAALPAKGERLTLDEDPCLTAKSLLGSYTWLEDQGIDADLIQGFQSVGGVEPWTAPLADGSGDCILIRADDDNGWRDIACDSPGVPAEVERTVDGAILRLTIGVDGVVAQVTSP